MLNLKRIRERGMNLRLLWDLFMVAAAIANLLLILFDLSYFYLRPYYFAHAPQVVAWYDPYKGAEAHPLTERFARLAERWTRAELSPAERERLAVELQATAARMQEENPFAEAGRPEGLQELVGRMVLQLVQEGRMPERAPQEAFRFAEVAGAYFALPPELRPEDLLAARAESVAAELQPILERNYRRAVRVDGSPVDRFYLLDGPFLTLFLIEFLVRWILAVRRREHARWWLFPAYNWYDVLGLIPVQELRIFRLARIVSIYVRLHRSDLTHVGDDIVSRTVKRYSAILTEEISDRVAVRILTEMQDEIRSGASVDVFLNALEPRRERLKAVLTESVKRFASERPGQEELRQILEKSLSDAAGRVPSLAVVPGFVKETLTREIGLAVFDAINDALAQDLRGRVGRGAVADMIDFVLDEAVRSGTESDLRQLYNEAALDVLENLKAAVAVKKWSLPSEDDETYRSALLEAQNRARKLQAPDA